MKKKILIFNEYYFPGYKAGGPIKSIKNIVSNLSEYFEFYIVAKNKDFGDKEPYKKIKSNSWNKLDKENVYYYSGESLKITEIKKIINSYDFDKIYLNSFFSRNSIKILLLKKLKIIKTPNIIIAPRGEFSPGALNIKNKKKKLFLKMSKLIGLYDNLFWHFTDKKEKEYVSVYFNTEKAIIIPNLVEKSLESNPHKRKNEDKLKLLFLSRISPKKNIHGALAILSQIKDIDIIYDIYGPISDENYYKQLKKIIMILPENIQVNFKGAINPNNLKGIFIDYDLFFFPTLGENFGHAILESLSYGTPVLISDQTPWNDLKQKNAGMAYNLKQTELFVNYIKGIALMDKFKFKILSDNAFEYYKNFEKTQKENIEKYKEMFS
jgi:glycosyltransferase involved in cell wall biosynthesis